MRTVAGRSLALILAAPAAALAMQAAAVALEETAVDLAGVTILVPKGWTDLMDAAPAAERFFELLDAREEVPDLPDAVRITGVHDGIRISKLAFSYGREPVLHDFSLDVKAGEVVAIVGRTGAGGR